MTQTLHYCVFLVLVMSLFLGLGVFAHYNDRVGGNSMTAKDIEMRDRIKRQQYRRVNIQCGDELFEVTRAELIPKLSEGGRTVVYSEVGKLLIIHKIEK